MTVDTILNGEMRPVFVGEPHEVLRRLKAGHQEAWVRVLVGSTGDVLTIPEYLHGEKLTGVQEAIWDVLKKSEQGMYKRDKVRLNTYIERTALRIIKLVQEG